MSNQRNVEYRLEKSSDFLFGSRVESVDDNFLQALVEMKANIYPSGKNVFMVAWKSYIEFIPYQAGRVELELLATPNEDRGKGYATTLMKTICEVAGQTDTIITLRTATVRRGFMGFKSIVHAVACSTKGKIPSTQLPKFYSKFGFERNKEKSWRNEPKEGTRMIRYPKKVESNG
jgi:GNAT superfamily N-acetyltransferase